MLSKKLIYFLCLFLQFRSTDPKVAAGYTERRQLFATPVAGQTQGSIVWKYKSTPTYLYCRPETDLNSCSLPLVSDVGLRLEMNLAEPAFCLITAEAGASEGFKLKITSATLLMPVSVQVFTLRNSYFVVTHI